MTPHAPSMRVAMLAAFVFALAAPIGAQQSGAAPAARPGILGAASDLRQLVTAQEAYFADNGRYADDLTKTQFRPSAGNTAKLVRPQADRYGAEITGTAFEGSCVVHVGQGANEYPRTAKENKAFPEGEPACDGDGELEDVRWASAARFEVQRMLASIAKLQEQRFGRTSAYAATIEELEGLRANPSVKVTMQVTPPGGRMSGYLITASHDRYPQASCILRSGFAPFMRAAMTAQRRRPEAELQVACDEFKK
jgi:hypothetical protein